MPSGGCVALPTLYTPEEIADKLRVSRRSVYHWLTSGKLDGLKAGQYWRITEEDLISFMKRHRPRAIKEQDDNTRW
jgi:excisionase family DNA binding protein